MKKMKGLVKKIEMDSNKTPGLKAYYPKTDVMTIRKSLFLHEYLFIEWVFFVSISMYIIF